MKLAQTKGDLCIVGGMVGVVIFMGAALVALGLSEGRGGEVNGGILLLSLGIAGIIAVLRERKDVGEVETTVGGLGLKPEGKKWEGGVEGYRVSIKPIYEDIWLERFTDVEIVPPLATQSGARREISGRDIEARFESARRLNNRIRKAWIFDGGAMKVRLEDWPPVHGFEATLPSLVEICRGIPSIPTATIHTLQKAWRIERVKKRMNEAWKIALGFIAIIFAVTYLNPLLETHLGIRLHAYGWIGLGVFGYLALVLVWHQIRVRKH